MQQCEYFLVQYVPSPGAQLRLPIGLILLDASGRLVQFGMTRNWRAIRCLDPRADLKLLASLPDYFEQLLAEAGASNMDTGTATGQPRPASKDLRPALARMAASGRGAVAIAIPQGVETEDPEREFARLFAEHVEIRRAAVSRSAPRAGSRRWIQAQLRQALERRRLWDRLRRNIAVEEFTAPGDAFRIDFAYRPNGITKYWHALSLEHDWNQAKVLSYTFGRIHQRTPAAMTAIVADTAPELAAAQSCRRILLDTGIALQPLSGLDGFLEQVRGEIGPLP